VPRTQRKLTAIFALAGSVTVLLGVLSYNSVSRLMLDAQWVAHTHDVVSELNAIDASFVVAETSGGAAAQLETREHLRVVRELTVDNPAQQVRLAALDMLIERAFSDASPSTPAALRQERRAIREMVLTEESLLAGRKELGARSSSFSLIAIAVGSALAAAIVFGAHLFVRRDFTRAECAERALREMNATLDQRVNARTRELQKANQRLESAEQRMRLAHAVFESMQEGLFITDLSGRIVAVNPAFRAIMEYNDSELIGQHLRMLRSGRHDPSFYDTLWKSVQHSGHWRGEVWNRRKGGEISPQWIGISTVRGEEGAPQYYVGVCADIGRMHHARSHLQYLAHHDSLTGLANRSLLSLRLRHTIERARRDGGRCGVLYLDLDGFKLVNDRLGHDAGDDLLRRVAGRMARRLRDIDTLARLGGDEFVLVLEQLAEDADAEDVARSIISRLTRWFRLSNGKKVSVGVSIGISIYPDDGDDADALLRQADVALYRAKSAGRGTVKFAREIIEQISASG
jgi:diguanylate cyclase (GGDEF)-like protein/PAS domain S-box-containing protein